MMTTPSFEVSLEVRFERAHRYVVSSTQLRISKQHIHIMRTHDGIAADEVLVVVLDAVMVVEVTPPAFPSSRPIFKRGQTAPIRPATLTGASCVSRQMQWPPMIMLASPEHWNAA